MKFQVRHYHLKLFYCRSSSKGSNFSKNLFSENENSCSNYLNVISTLYNKTNQQLASAYAAMSYNTACHTLSWDWFSKNHIPCLPAHNWLWHITKNWHPQFTLQQAWHLVARRIQQFTWTIPIEEASMVVVSGSCSKSSIRTERICGQRGISLVNSSRTDHSQTIQHSLDKSCYKAKMM